MKKVLFFVLAFAAMQVYYSCSNQTTQESKAVATAEMNISIDGMTCAEGCAKTIEKTVAELAGVTFCKVNFDEKTATFKYDDSKIDDKKILEAITALNEGQYKVTSVEVKIEKNANDAEGVNAVEEKLMKDTAV